MRLVLWKPGTNEKEPLRHIVERQNGETWLERPKS